jgi:hypothetical protein
VRRHRQEHPVRGTVAWLSVFQFHDFFSFRGALFSAAADRSSPSLRCARRDATRTPASCTP